MRGTVSTLVQASLSACNETPLPLAHRITAHVEGTLELENYLLAIKDQGRHKASPERAALKSKVSACSHSVTPQTAQDYRGAKSECAREKLDTVLARRWKSASPMRSRSDVAVFWVSCPEEDGASLTAFLGFGME